jgi:hypothetical protein
MSTLPPRGKIGPCVSGDRPPVPQQIKYGSGGSHAHGVRRQNVLTSIGKRTKWQQVQFSIGNQDDIRLRPVFRDDAQESLEEFLRKWQVVSAA